jgi:hypothetical protein
MFGEPLQKMQRLAKRTSRKEERKYGRENDRIKKISHCIFKHKWAHVLKALFSADALFW